MLSDKLLKLNNSKPYSFTPEVHEINTVSKEIKSINDNKKPTHALADYCGKYSNSGYGTFDISLEKNILYASFPAYKLRMEHKHYNVFVLKLITDIPQVVAPEFDLNFSINNDGEISSVNIDFQREDVNFKKDAKN